MVRQGIVLEVSLSQPEMTCDTKEDTSPRGDARNKGIETKIDDLAKVLVEVSERRRQDTKWAREANCELRDKM